MGFFGSLFGGGNGGSGYSKYKTKSGTTIKQGARRKDFYLPQHDEERRQQVHHLLLR